MGSGGLNSGPHTCLGHRCFIHWTSSPATLWPFSISKKDNHYLPSGDGDLSCRYLSSRMTEIFPFTSLNMKRHKMLFLIYITLLFPIQDSAFPPSGKSLKCFCRVDHTFPALSIYLEESWPLSKLQKWSGWPKKLKKKKKLPGQAHSRVLVKQAKNN